MPSFTPSTPARAFNTNFTPSATKYVLCIYTVEIVATATVTGGTSGIVEFLSDTSATPTTVRCSARSAFTITLGLGIGFNSTQRFVLAYVVPPGHNVRLATTGAATMTIVNQTEEIIDAKFDPIDFAAGFPTN